MAHDSSSKKGDYKAQSIRVIEGLEAVRKRPAMYIGSTGVYGLHHLVYEIVDNSVDEALAGHCRNIYVTLHSDGSCEVEDDGRGIPTDIHPTEKVSAAEVALTKLHAGGKFDKDTYKYSGGLHGVGVSVVNALSSKLELTVFRDGKIHKQFYERGKPLAPLHVVGDTKKQGTVVRFTPDPLIFQETTAFSFDTLSTRLRELAFLNKGLHIIIEEEATTKKHDFLFEGGIISFVEYINSVKGPLFPDIIYFENQDETYVVQVALQYNDGYGEQLFSFVNNINTIDGGTHVAGFKSALTKVCNKRAQEFGILKNGESFSSEDVREGLVAVISIKVPEPQFEGQTKGKLGNSDVKGVVDSWCFSFLETFFEENPAIGKKILQKAEIAKRARDAAKRARDLTRRSTVLGSAILPGKLADCSNENPSETELFIVEGDSAGGSAKQGRNRNNQAILPLKGKILNVEKARLDKILSNEEIKALIAAIGCGIGEEEFDIAKTRYHKIILMTDADVDGAHIRTLLLTFFFRYMPKIIESGYLYVAQPPLYKAKIGKKEQYLKDDSELKGFLFEWAREQTTISCQGAPLAETVWHQQLDGLSTYDILLERTSNAFRITKRQAHFLINLISRGTFSTTLTPQQVQEFFARACPTLTISLEAVGKTEQTGEEGIPAQPTHLVVASLKSSWRVPLNFFVSPELHDLQTQFVHLNQFQNSWVLAISDKERTLSGTTIIELIDAVIQISKPYLNIQRYKGLGEMNAEQLWETSMDETQRTLLKVTIEDALEADHWFATLMGDDVAGRKDYIEEFGQFVKNLDV